MDDFFYGCGVGRREMVRGGKCVLGGDRER